MDAALLDTDTLSEVLKREDRQVLEKAQACLAENERLAFSAMTAYEIIRGLKAKRAKRQLAGFLKTVEPGKSRFTVYEADATFPTH